MRPTLLVVALVVVGAVAAGGIVTADEEADEADEPLGASMSSFMQASTAEAEGEVDDGMFEASLDRTDDPEERRALIEARQQRLQERSERLENARGAIETDDPAVAAVRDRALAVRVGIGARMLERSVNGTRAVAEEVGADTEALDELRENARGLRGSSVSELARNHTGPPNDVGQSPGVGSQNATDSPANGSPDDVETGPPNGSDAGNGTNVTSDIPLDQGNGTNVTDGIPLDEGNGTDVLDEENETDSSD